VERLQVDQEFHLKIAETCNNRFIKNTLEKIFEKLILKRSLEGFPQRGEEVYKEHEVLVDCISRLDTIRKGRAGKPH